MALLVTIPGGAVQLAGTPVKVVVESDSYEKTAYALLLKITSLDGSFPEAILNLEPTIDGGVASSEFDIRSSVDLPVQFNFTWPLSGNVFTNHATIAKRLKLDIGEYYIENGAPVKNWAGLAGSQYELTILKGGVGKHTWLKWQELNDKFYTEFVSAGRFLTHLPDNLKISPSQPVKLWYITPEVTNQDLNLKVNYTLIDNTEGTITIAGTVNTGQICELDVDPATLGLVPANVASYSVYLDKAGVPVSETRTFILDQDYRENNRFILLSNSLSSVDVFWFSGTAVKRFSTTEKTSTREMLDTDTRKNATVVVDYKSGQRSWEVSTFIEKIQVDWMPELLLTRNIWLIEGNDVIPVRIEANEKDLEDEFDNDVIQFAAKLIEAHENTHF